MKNILVTGIGGVVGQGILRNLRAEAFDAGIVGCNVDGVSAGNHLCDAVHVVPYAVAPDYLPRMRELVRRERIDLVIPSTDYEVHNLMRPDAALPDGVVVAASPADVSGMCLDKYDNAVRFAAAGLPFARSVLPSTYRGGFDRVVVKPREGRGSRGIHVDPADPRAFGDDHVVQEYLDGDELTTAFYVRRDGTLHGLITLSRELEQGNTARCEVVRAHDAELEAMIRRMIAAFPFRGSCNLQTRVTPRGIVPFEINCRISGTNSVRARFGFRDVAYTVQEYLLDRAPDPAAITDGCALRVILDVVYPGIGLDQVRDRTDRFTVF